MVGFRTGREGGGGGHGKHPRLPDGHAGGLLPAVRGKVGEGC